MNNSIKAEVKDWEEDASLHTVSLSMLALGLSPSSRVSSCTLAIRPGGGVEGLQRGSLVTGVKLEEKPVNAACRWVVLL